MIKFKGTKTVPRRRNDELLKGAFEENFQDFLRFIYPKADDLFDFSKPIEFIDKELLPIVPNRDKKEGKRIADLLAKVQMKDGTRKWILVHTEIEGGSQKDFSYRLFQYHYRLMDRNDGPVETIVVFTGDNKQSRPSSYHNQVIDTQLSFRYKTYHIFDHSEAELLAMDNVFALIVLACQKALKEGKVPDIELGEDRLTIAKALLKHNYDRDHIITFLVFLKNFLYNNDQEINRIFDKQLEQLTNSTIDMGVIEIIKKQERKKGLQKGLEKGRLEERKIANAEKLAEKLESARTLKKMGVAIEIIVESLGLTVKQVENLK